jgi:hypothetical protein
MPLGENEPVNRFDLMMEEDHKSVKTGEISADMTGIGLKVHFEKSALC